MHHRGTRTDVRAMRCSGNREYGKGGGVEKVWNGTLLFVRFRKKRTSCVASSRPSARARAAAVGACSSRHLVSCRVGEIVVCTRTFSLAFAASAASAIAKASATVAGASKRGSPGATRSSTSRASTSSASRRVMRSRKDTCGSSSSSSRVGRSRRMVRGMRGSPRGRIQAAGCSESDAIEASAGNHGRLPSQSTSAFSRRCPSHAGASCNARCHGKRNPPRLFFYPGRTHKATPAPTGRVDGTSRRRRPFAARPEGVNQS